jgi:hypothetical protein
MFNFKQQFVFVVRDFKLWIWIFHILYANFSKSWLHVNYDYEGKKISHTVLRTGRLSFKNLQTAPDRIAQSNWKRQK